MTTSARGGKDHDHDVLIVGAGPAGSQLALRLARRGWSVCLFDRERFPRPKPCGEFMSPECLPLLEELGLRERVLRLGARRLRGMRVHGYGRRTRGDYRALGLSAARFDHGYAIRREVLDHELLRAAAGEEGVAVREGWRVTGLVRAADGSVAGVRVRPPGGAPVVLRAPFTVGADGRQSVVARELGARRFVRGFERYALVARFADVPATEHGEVHVFDGGYFAAAPIDGGLFTLNLVVPEIPPGRARLLPFLRDRLRRAPDLAARVGSAEPVGGVLACGPLAVATRARTFDGAALVGDACGFVDPLTGEGLWFAMEGARLLAESLDRALRAGDCRARALRGYERAHRRTFGPRYAFERVLQEGLRRPRVARQALSLLEGRPGLTELVVGLAGDCVPPGALLSPAVWRRALRRR